MLLVRVNLYMLSLDDSNEGLRVLPEEPGDGLKNGAARNKRNDCWRQFRGILQHFYAKEEKQS